jgi:alpha-glucosidase
VPYEHLQDPYGIRFWPKFKGRDGCRTPMPWVTDNANGGFTDGKPWLPMAVEHLSHSVAAQEDKPGSMLDFYRRMIAFRATEPALAKGDFTLLQAEEGVLAFTRHHEGRRVLCVFNLTDRPQTVALPDGDWTILAAPFDAPAPDLGPWQALYAAQEAQDG